ncbi:MAG TPA: sugar porter family MFS transporter [Sedimentisphaerales bacterium]|jgi:SP family xylose:H+ symportor-like MFS transporter|nr:sugar porter family MFS transporter [Sedimentisphaerales bacterium]HNU31100.1 sugar porter family MFS transporter [Sedimentisphaerales bacterium]
MDESRELADRRAGSTTYVLMVTLVAALGGLLFGYDTGVINGAIGPLKAHFQLDDVQEGWATGCALLGCALGAAGVGSLSDRFGRKKSLIVSAILFFMSAVGTAIPRTLTTFILYRILGGLGVGAASIISPMYIAEISPARIRGRMVSINQFAIVSGFLVVYFVNYFIALQGDAAWNERLGWRWMFGSEALPALGLMILSFLVPESPRWLTKQRRAEEALHILTRVDGAAYAQAELAEIKEALAHEGGSLRLLFQPGMRIVLAIGIVLAVLQQVTGINVFLYFGTEIFKKMGSGTNAALLQTIVVGVVNLTFTVVAIRTVDRIGRRPLMMIGSAGMGVSLVAMGLAAYLQSTGLWMLLFILGYIACFALSVGPVTWVILSEIFPTRIRGRAMAVATVCLWIANYLVSQTFPMMDEHPWLVAMFHRGFPFWLYGAFCIVLLAFVRACVPETKGKSLEQIERHWTR